MKLMNYNNKFNKLDHNKIKIHKITINMFYNKKNN